jgi:hypothetical protein
MSNAAITSVESVKPEIGLFDDPITPPGIPTPSRRRTQPAASPAPLQSRPPIRPVI